MGKLVLFLADGTTMDVPLDKERITIGRRADNDVCLPYPAVSGEHAAVVTILADSFLEDLGSTNGTLVNGKAVAKHFLVDHDMIDIGRQRLTYMSDNEARVEPLPPDIARSQLRGLSEKVASARPVPSVAAPGDVRVHASARSAPLVADLEQQMRAPGPPEPPHRTMGESPMPGSASTPGGASAAVARGDAGPAPVDRAKSQAPAARRIDRPTLPGADALAGLAVRDHASPTRAAPIERKEASPREGAEPAPAADPTTPIGPCVRVLSGPSIGRTLPITKDELSIGRVGAQVALVRRTPDGYRLVPLEGAQPPRINGAPVAPGGAALHPGDTFEIAGVRLELSAGA
jgi:hypothetical protein